MPKNKLVLIVGTATCVLVAAVFGYLCWKPNDPLATRTEMLSLMPEEAGAVFYLDLSQLRSSVFLAQLLRWAPQPAMDSDYAQFLQATGFNYERDLDRVALAVNQQPQNAVLAVADGRFNRKKIQDYATSIGSPKILDGREIFSVTTGTPGRVLYFMFINDNRMLLTNSYTCFIRNSPTVASSAEWREHFSRLAGAPVFAILRHDSGTAMALSQAPGGLRSPQLAVLLAQLQWISVSGKPEGNVLRVGIEGESLTENTIRQLKELLSGLLVLAQIGLNDPKARTQVAPEVQEGYQQLLQSVDIQQVDRGTSKSVRVIFDVSPKLLQSVSKPTAAAADPPSHTQSGNRSQGKKDRK